VLELRSRRRGRLSTNAGLSIALGACLCAGSLIGAGSTTAASAPAAPAPITVSAPAPEMTLVASTTSAAAKRKAKRAKIIAEARKHRGKPYRYGAAGPYRFDCSGFTKYVMRKAIGKNLPHKANSQKNYGRWVPRNQAQPGDLVIFKNGSYAYHVGIYAGNGYMYDSPRPGKTVGKHKIWTKSYSVRRIV
jgi:cell wall-associated NlpC family hydrolase